MRKASSILITGLSIGVMSLVTATMGSTAEPSTASLSLRAAIHVHSTMSTGSLSLESLATRAEHQGLDVLILSENYILRYDYGLYPFEGFLKYQVTFPSIMEYGLQEFIEEVHAVQRRHPKLIIIPGAEIAPHYYWTGSLLRGDLTMHNAQRNLLVIGLEKSEDYLGLPSHGNPDSFMWTWRSLANGLPLLFLVPIVKMWKQHVSQRAEGLIAGSHVRHGLVATLALLCLGLLVNAWPMKMPLYGSHDSGLGFKPYQALIDTAIERGALVFWSMTEARDFSRHSFGPLGIVTVKTEPHPEALVLTSGYTGFGGLYQDARRVVAPGGIWDQLLRSFVPTDHRVFPSLIGEIAFHDISDPGKDLNQVYTVILSTNRTAAGVMDSLRAGRSYAVARGDQNVLLRLDEFRISSAGASALIGETLERSRNSDIIVRVRIATFDEKRRVTRLRVIRSGEIIREVEGATPLELELIDHEAMPGEWLNYRVEVTGTNGELLTNPIYVAPTQGVSAAAQQRTADLVEHPDHNARFVGG